MLFYGYSSVIFDTPYKIKAGTISCSIEPYETMNSPATTYRRFLLAVLIALGSIIVGIIINGVIIMKYINQPIPAKGLDSSIG